MRKLLFILSLIGGLLSVPTNLMADEGQKKSIRLFLNTGELLDFDADVIDSITFSSNAQTIWYDDTCRTVAIEAIDSIWYMTPSLKLTTKSLDFGKVAVGNARSTHMTITNTGDFEETYSLFADGVFKAANSGHDFRIASGESQDMQVDFVPRDPISYNGHLLLSSSAVSEGLFSLSMRGEGVAADSLEEISVIPPAEVDIAIVMPDSLSPALLTGFKIVNGYGEFPISTEAAAKAYSIRRASSNGMGNYTFNSSGLVSRSGLQAHFLVDGFDNPFLYGVSLSDGKVEMSFEQTAISLVMLSPLLITCNEAEYRNAVNIIKSLTSFKNLVGEVARAYYIGLQNHRTPDYSVLSVDKVISELYQKHYDNSIEKLSGASIIDLYRTPEKVQFRIKNSYKRSLHIYTSKVKMSDNNLVVSEQKENSMTLTDLCDQMLSYLIGGVDEAQDKMGMVFDEEDLEFINDLKDMIAETEKQFMEKIFHGASDHLCLPIILEAGHADYMKIVGDAWDVYFHDLDTSIFEVETGTINADVRDFDKVYVDVYGMGLHSLDKPFSDYSGIEQMRIVYALIYGAYYDIMKPMLNFKKAWNESVAAAGSYENKYDFRYGARKYPELALVTKLVNDFTKTVKKEGKEEYENQLLELGERWYKKDYKGIAKQLATFMWDCLKKAINENPDEDKRTYTNLIYNIYKKWTGTTATSAELRKDVKEFMNNVRYLRDMNFIGKVISTTEAALDAAGAVDALLSSDIHERFIIDKSDQPYLKVISPTAAYSNTNQEVHFEWELFKSRYYGDMLFDIELTVQNPDQRTVTTVKTDIDGNSYNYDLSKFKVGSNTLMIQFRLIAHRADDPNAVIATTDNLPLVVFTKENAPEFVDLGLPSGTQWAVCNVGATQADAYGDYYAWGEISPKTTFSWKNYKYSGNTSNSLTKYNTKSSYGKTDGLIELQGADDPIRLKYGYYYSIPTAWEWGELITQCTWRRHGNGVVGRGPNGNIIYLPRAGYCSGYHIYDQESACYYWSSTLDEQCPDDAWYFYVGDSDINISGYYRYQGRSLRPILRKEADWEHNPRRSVDKKEVKEVVKHENGLVIGITRKPGGINE